MRNMTSRSLPKGQIFTLFPLDSLSCECLGRIIRKEATRTVNKVRLRIVLALPLIDGGVVRHQWVKLLIAFPGHVNIVQV